MNGWSFEPILDSYTLVLVISGALAILTFASRPRLAPVSTQSRPEAKSVAGTLTSRRHNWILMALRLGLIGLLLLAMLRPARVRTESQPQSSTLILLVDQSRSMNVADQPDGRSRWQAVASALDSAFPKLEALAEVVELEGFGFDQELGKSILGDQGLLLPQEPAGEQTDIARSLREALQRSAGKRIAGVMVITDGAQRVYQPKFDLSQSAADLKRLNAPLFAIPVGEPRDQTQARDIAIEKLNDQYTVFVKNEVEVRGALRIQGFVNQPIPVRIEVLGPDGESTTLGPIRVTATADDQLTDFRFPFAPQKPGAYTLKVVAEPQQGELVDANNQMTAYLTALDGGIRILFVEGNLFSPEAQVLRWSIGSFEDVELDFRAIDARRKSQWPVQLEDVLDSQKYDVIIIGDVDSKALGEVNLRRFASHVTERGGGLLMLGGVNTLGPGGYRDSPLAAILPVELGQFDRQEFGPDKPIRSDLHLNGPLTIRPVPGRNHFVMQLGANATASQQAWQRLTGVPLQFANRFDRLRPNAIRIAESQEGDPLIVAREFAPGRILVSAVDSTHLWWRRGYENLHKRFWRQVILWLANQDEVMRRNVWIQLDRRRFRPGEVVTFRAGVKSESGESMTDATMSATFRSAETNPITVHLSRDRQDWVGQLPSLETPGEYTIEVQATKNGRFVGSGKARFQLEEIDLELADPAASPQQLAMLANMTAAAGGKSLPLEQLEPLLDELRTKPPETKVEVRSKWRFGDRTADAWPFFIVFVTLLCYDWFLRKRWGLN